MTELERLESLLRSELEAIAASYATDKLVMRSFDKSGILIDTRTTYTTDPYQNSIKARTEAVLGLIITTEGEDAAAIKSRIRGIQLKIHKALIHWSTCYLLNPLTELDYSYVAQQNTNVRDPNNRGWQIDLAVPFVMEYYERSLVEIS